jgi:hypothetical protein
MKTGSETQVCWRSECQRGCYYPKVCSECGCPPCPGRGNDGHRMTHCAECCFGTGVKADPSCPVHGLPAIRVGD